MDQQSLTQLVGEIVSHLYDDPYLQMHPLGRLLVPERVKDPRGRALQRAVIEAIHALRPAAESAGSGHAWRAYRYLFLRYVQVLPPADVARQLAISERQARRTNREAVEALASVLWDSCQAIPNRDAGKTDPLTSASTEGGDEIAASSRTGVSVSPTVPPSAPDPPTVALLDQEVSYLTAEGSGTTDLTDVVDGLLPIIGALARQHGCTWVRSARSELPGIDADRVVVRQILLNLCSLAFARGPGQLTLQTKSAPGRVQITLAFATSGAEVMDRGESSLVAEERLAISQRLVESEGGALEVRETADGSLVATVSLRSSRPPLVLVVDDNPDVSAVFRRYLETAGFAVVVARRGVDAVRMAQEALPVAITLDVMMATQDGWETLQQLKNHPTTHDIPVIICSVLREEGLARFLGAAALLPKPVTQPALLAALAGCNVLAPGKGHRSSS